MDAATGAAEGRMIMALRCKDCKHDKGRCVGSSRKGSHQYCFEAKVMTNADRIRAMSDEELAEFVFSMVDCVSCENKLMNNGKLIFGTERKTCTVEDYHSMCNGDGRKCKSVCLKWLQQPAGGAKE